MARSSITLTHLEKLIKCGAYDKKIGKMKKELASHKCGVILQGVEERAYKRRKRVPNKHNSIRKLFMKKNYMHCTNCVASTTIYYAPWKRSQQRWKAFDTKSYCDWPLSCRDSSPMLEDMAFKYDSMVLHFDNTPQRVEIHNEEQRWSGNLKWRRRNECLARTQDESLLFTEERRMVLIR